MEPKIQAKTFILPIKSETPFVLHNSLSHSDAYMPPISTQSRYPAIHLLPTLNADCPQSAKVRCDQDTKQMWTDEARARMRRGCKERGRTWMRTREDEDTGTDNGTGVWKRAGARDYDGRRMTQ